MKKSIESLIFNAGCIATAVAGNAANNFGVDGNYLAISAAYLWQNTTVESLKNFLNYGKNYFAK